MVVTPSFLYDFSRMFHFGYHMGGKSAFISLRTTEKQKHNVTKGTVNVISIQCGHTTHRRDVLYYYCPKDFQTVLNFS